MRFLLAAIMLGLAAQAPPQTQQGLIQGVVTKAGTNEPLAGVRIAVGLGYLPSVTNYLFQPRSLVAVATSIVNVVTDDAGRFSVANLGPGTYTVRADRDGFWGTVEAEFFVLSVSKEVQLDPQNLRAQVALSLIPGGLVTGSVQMPNGNAAANMAVSAYRVRYMEGRRVLTTNFTQPTNERGEYRLFSLPPGEYYIGAGTASRSPLASPSTVSTTYFPRATDARLAQTVNVAPGAEIGGIDIAMQGLPSVTVSGRLIGPDSAPVNGGFNFVLIPRDESAFVENIEPGLRNSANDTSKGQFELRGVVPGSYRMYVRLLGATIGGFTEIEVPQEGLRDVVVTIRPAVDVRGRILMNDSPLPPVSRAALTGVVAGTPLTLNPPPASISLRAVDTTTIARSYSATIDATGAFAFSGVTPGIYRIQGPLGAIGPAFAGLPPDAYVADVQEQNSVFDSGLTIDARTPEELRVIVKKDGATVDGSVLNAQNKPGESATVILVPAPDYRENGLRYRMGTTDANGHFSIANVQPGQYKAFASTARLAAFNIFRSPSYVKNVEELGLGLSVGPSEKRTLQLKVIPQ